MLVVWRLGLLCLLVLYDGFVIVLLFAVICCLVVGYFGLGWGFGICVLVGFACWFVLGFVVFG